MFGLLGGWRAEGELDIADGAFALAFLPAEIVGDADGVGARLLNLAIAHEGQGGDMLLAGLEGQRAAEAAHADRVGVGIGGDDAVGAGGLDVEAKMSRRTAVVAAERGLKGLGAGVFQGEMQEDVFADEILGSVGRQVNDGARGNGVGGAGVPPRAFIAGLGREDGEEESRQGERKATVHGRESGDNG